MESRIPSRQCSLQTKGHDVWNEELTSDIPTVHERELQELDHARPDIDLFGRPYWKGANRARALETFIASFAEALQTRYLSEN